MPSLCYCGNQTATKNGWKSHHLLCNQCASKHHLASQISKYNTAKTKHAQQKEECHARLLETRLAPIDGDNNTTTTNSYEHDEDDALEPLSSRQPLPDPSQINQHVSQLKQQLDKLRSQSNALAVRVTAKTMENDERQEQLQVNLEKVQLAKERLDRMSQCMLMQSESFDANSNVNASPNEVGGMTVIGGGLKDALVSGTQQIQTLRFHFACKVFDMHRLDVGEKYTKQSGATKDDEAKKANESATGVGKIGGLPLPHAGPALYGVIPPLVLASSLRLVASLTQLVARCLGVVLPHPILVCFRECSRCGGMYDFGADVIDVSVSDECDDEVDEEFLDDSENHKLCTSCREGTSDSNAAAAKATQQTNEPSTSTSTLAQKRSYLLKFVGSSARKAIAITSSATTRAITHMHQSTASIDSATSSGSTIMARSSMNNAAQQPASPVSNAMSKESIAKRISHASFAYLRENHDKSATEYVLNPPRWNETKNDASIDSRNQSSSNKPETTKSDPTHTSTSIFATREEFHVAEERFATGMQLLQNDVVALCFRAGVDVSTLWPAESVLLNLYSLWHHCKTMAESTSQ